MLTMIIVSSLLFVGYRFSDGSVLSNGLLSLIAVALFVILDSATRGLPVAAYVTVFIVLFTSLQFMIPIALGKSSLQCGMDGFRVSVGRVAVLYKQNNGLLFAIGVS